MWGPDVVETPNIDWIAQQGLLCTSFYATTPVCSPSRSSLVSGRYPQRTPVVNNDIPMSDDIVTFAELLRRAGYATGFAGKWHLDGNGKPQWAPKRNFGFVDNRYMFNRGHWKQLEDTPNGPRVAATNANGAPTYVMPGANEKNFTTDFLCDKKIEFIKNHRDEPFCYYVSIPDPHGPDTVRGPYDRIFADQTFSKPRTFDPPQVPLPSWGQPQQSPLSQAGYWGMVKCIDDNVGKLLAALRSEKLLDRTIIVFTSDHGDLRGEHHRQNKGVPYEGSARIPFLMHFPGKIQPGTVIHEALSCVDFQPTVLKLMGVALSGQEDGREASTLFTTGKAPDDWNDIAFVRGTGNQSWLMAVTDRYKLVYSPSDPPYLFDLERDPDEVVNFFTHDGYRQIVRDLSQQLREYGQKYEDPSIAAARIKSDLDWAIEGTGAYTPPGKRR